MNFTLKLFEQLANTELYNILKVRTEVFVVEQKCPYPEVDGKDLQSYHLYKEENGEIIAFTSRSELRRAFNWESACKEGVPKTKACSEADGTCASIYS